MKTVLRFPVGIVSAIGVFFLVSCSPERQQAKGFVLPEGDIEVGKSTFIELQCNRCHSVEGVELPEFGLHGGPQVALGGEILKVKSYGELVTSIISPAHIVSPNYLAMLSEEEQKSGIQSPMPVFNEEMTVKQLIDLVAFLHSRYQKLEPDYHYHYIP